VTTGTTPSSSRGLSAAAIVRSATTGSALASPKQLSVSRNVSASSAIDATPRAPSAERDEPHRHLLARREDLIARARRQIAQQGGRAQQVAELLGRGAKVIERRVSIGRRQRFERALVPGEDVGDRRERLVPLAPARHGCCAGEPVGDACERRGDYHEPRLCERIRDDPGARLDARGVAHARTAKLVDLEPPHEAGIIVHAEGRARCPLRSKGARRRAGASTD
jgi:hypothetical protein